MKIGEVKIRYGVVGVERVWRIWLQDLPRELFDAFPGNEGMFVPDDNRFPTFYVKVFSHNRIEFRIQTLEGKDGRIDGILEPLPDGAIVPVVNQQKDKP